MTWRRCTSDQRSSVLKLPCEAALGYVGSRRCPCVCRDILRRPGLESCLDQIEWIADYNTHGARNVAGPEVGGHYRNGMGSFGLGDLEGYFWRCWNVGRGYGRGKRLETIVAGAICDGYEEGIVLIREMRCGFGKSLQNGYSVRLWKEVAGDRPSHQAGHAQQSPAPCTKSCRRGQELGDL